MEQNSKQHRERLQAGYIELALSMQPNAFVTLATNDYGDIPEMTRLIGKFCGMVDRDLLGHKWHRLPAEQRLNGIFFIEHVATNIHAHGILRFSDTTGADLRVLTERKWNRLTKAGSTAFKLFCDTERCISYCTKEMKSFLFNGDQIVLARQFMTH